MKIKYILFCLLIFVVSSCKRTQSDLTDVEDLMMVIHERAWIQGANAAITAIEEVGEYNNELAKIDYRLDSIQIVTMIKASRK